MELGRGRVAEGRLTPPAVHSSTGFYGHAESGLDWRQKAMLLLRFLIALVFAGN
jgi:hypothetical protein